MANTSITTYAPTAYHTDGDINTHKALPTAKWIGNGSGSSSYEVITQTLTKTHGNSSDRPFEAKNTNLFQVTTVASDIYDRAESRGFQFGKTSTTSEVAVNLAVKHYGSNGMVIPASLFRSLGVEFKRNVTANANWRIWNIGLEFRSLVNNAWSPRLYSVAWTTAADSSTGYDYKCFNGASKVNTIRSWGAGWGLNRIIFNLRSNGTSGAQAPSAKLFHVKIGWDAELDDNHRIIKPQNQTWDQYYTDYQNGQRKFKA